MLILLAALALTQTPPEETPPPDTAEIERLEQARQDAEDQARAAEAEADALAAEIADLQARLVAAARRAESSERAALDAEDRIETLSAEEAEILARLTADREALIDVLAALQRIERGTPPAMAVAPGDAVEAARAAGLLSDIAPALRERADALATELERLRTVRGATLTQRGVLTEAEAALDLQRAEIEDLIAQRQDLENRRRGEAARYAEAARDAGREAQSLRGLMARLEAMSSVAPRLNPRHVEPQTETGIPTPELRPETTLVAALAPTEPLETRRFADFRGRLRPPVAGRIVRRFGAEDDNGEPSEGVLVSARPRAQVVSPFDAQVEFAGPFGAYHGLLILNVGDDYYMVIAGLAAVYAEAGRSVLAGEPLGAMPDRDDPASDLYLEIQRGGEAIDPEPWLRPDARAR